MIRSTESKANSELGVYCIARTMPVTIITTSTIPESEPKFHQYVRLRGVGYSFSSWFNAATNGSR
jgi:hypothetical protein